MSSKFKIQSSKFLLIIILLIASVLRLYQLGSVPVSPDWDEAALGYNAYSILQTGKDEYGKPFPFVLQSFADYKPALYIYFAVPSIAVFGLDTFAVRLPSAIFGILTVLATYFLVKELFKRRDIALVAAFLLAISPWHLQFSRVAFETNVGLAFNVFGVLFFLKGLKKPWLLMLSALFFGLNVSVYQSERVFSPLLVILLLLVYWKPLWQIAKKYLVAAVLVGIFAVLPFVHYVVTNNMALARFKGVSIFSEQTETKLESNQQFSEDKGTGNLTGTLFHNKWVTSAREVTAGYLSHFDLNWLFIRGDLERHHAPNMALLYLWELPFLLVGIYALAFFPFSLRTKLLIFGWLLLAPIPASVTSDVPHSVRTLNFLPTFQVFTAIGLVTAHRFLSQYKGAGIKYKGFYRSSFFSVSLYTLFFILASFNLIYYLNQYFVQQNYFYSKFWQYGYEEAVMYVKAQEDKFRKIVVANQTPLDQSYVFFLFYLQYPPQEYQKQWENFSGTLDDTRMFGKYEFRPINWEAEKDAKDVLFVGRPEDFPQDVAKKTIQYLNGEPAIVIVER